MAKEVSVRLHEELERLETKRTKAQDELERAKRLLDESEDRRLSLQKEVNSVTNEVYTLQSFPVTSTSNSPFSALFTVRQTPPRAISDSRSMPIA